MLNYKAILNRYEAGAGFEAGGKRINLIKLLLRYKCSQAPPQLLEPSRGAPHKRRKLLRASARYLLKVSRMLLELITGGGEGESSRESEK